MYKIPLTPIMSGRLNMEITKTKHIFTDNVNKT